MKKSQHHYHAIIEDVNDAIYTTDLRGYFTSINPAGERITGYTKKEFLKMHMSAVVSPEHLELVKKMMAKKFNADLSTVYEIEIIQKDGGKIPVEISSRSLYEDGVPVGIIGIARDITDRKSLEQQKDIFFSLITHEIKNPLSSIKAFAEVLKKYHEKRNEDKPRHYAAMIDDQVDKLTLLVNDFLDLSKMNTGKFSLKKEKFDIQELICTVADSFNSTNQDYKVTVKGKGAKYIYGDPRRIEQVLNNLINNAIKYSPKNSSIIIEAEKDKKNTRVHVIDNGPGIPEEKQNDIFELFYRLDKHRESTITGHGMGLYVCKQIVLGHKGDIWVENNKERGARFSFMLPLYQNKTSVIHAASPKEAS
jgi:PAS domain S-box-containing protein